VPQYRALNRRALPMPTHIDTHAAPTHSASTMFEDIFKEPTWNLREQRQRLGV